jgi:hypothetical protein
VDEGVVLERRLGRDDRAENLIRERRLGRDNRVSTDGEISAEESLEVLCLQWGELSVSIVLAPSCVEVDDDSLSMLLSSSVSIISSLCSVSSSTDGRLGRE